ncbi:YhjD/YihY/BrkB family envelope integrity protein [Nocardiopsis sp. NRRL B-16309]|uniref:YhjD/YihY/BrkB family envelope integrity protein n=1 Tax=Nocardiopsis sp. NRRL B-16309 TaxID=1519494 RepID=UPI0006AE5ED5|nr:YhjD/YihY/BrkB family envelope integrity protein [Nocardiopsis sp. NRRL B-16309]KOX20814.1 ribonuclease BN [Nocardiopsis sp. NRRL B-16309]
MAAALDRAKDGARHYRNLSMDAYWRLRRRHPAVDHAVRAYERYADRNGNQLAGAVTYFAFLSFFPLLALAFAVVGYLASMQVELTATLEEGIDGVLPGLSEQLPMDDIAQARVGAGVIGLLGLLYAGLNSVSALRQALHSIWLKSVKEGPNVLLRKAGDLFVMAGLGLALLLTVSFTSVGQAATTWLLALVGLDGSVWANLLLRLLALAIAISMNMVLFVLVFTLLSGSGRPMRMMWRGALLGAVGFEVLKATAAVLLAGTLSNPVYASFAVLVGLLVWINLVMRLVMFSAAWTATWLPMPAPYTGTLPLPGENGLDWSRRGPGARVSASALARHRVDQRIVAGIAALLGAAGAGGAAAGLLRRARRRDR